MKRIIKLIFSFQILLLSFSSGFSQNPFVFTPHSTDIGVVMAGDDISFTFTIRYDLGTPHSYWIKTWEIMEDQGWITNINNDMFSFTYNGEVVFITVIGVMTSDMPLGLNTFHIPIYLNEDYGNTVVASYEVTYDFGGTPGVEDHIEISPEYSSFSEGDFLHYDGLFIDEYPYGDEIEEWNLKIDLTSLDGSNYTYVDITNTYGYWHITAPNIPQNVIFKRNNQGRISGVLSISGIDTDGYTHLANKRIGINKEPDTPELHTFPYANTAEIFINNSGGTSNFLYYDTNSGEPYSGTGLLQGNSPINLGGSTSILLEGFQNCTKYYFAAKASNLYGTSDYSNERSFRIFNSSNGLPLKYHFTDCNITDNFGFDGNHYFTGNLIVETGAELILSGGIMYFEENSKIVIEPGGKLILNGATLTAPCGQTWQGIQVWGDKTQSQYCAAGQVCAQGRLELNGATIENAIIAVDLWNPGDYSTTGGIVYATDAVFRNNAKSVHALLYKNFNPYDPDTELDYFSNFNNCSFEITADYLGDEMFYKHVDLAYVKGIDFYGCDFSLAEKVEGVSSFNHAIAAYNSAFKVRAICNSQTAPCPEEYYDKCSFTGFYSAINAVNDGTLPLTFSINRANFVKNANGVKTRNMNNTSVLFSNFEIGHFWDCATGIHADNVTGFAFEENNFSKYSGEPVSDYFGIIINNSEAVNEVYKNDFTGLSYANFSEGKNWIGINTYMGLAYYCNDNIINYADFYVKDFEREKRSGIQSEQGNDNYSAGNTFTQNGATWHFYNGGEHLVDYYSNGIETPNINKKYRVNNIDVNVTNTCPSHYGGIISEKNLVLTAQQKADAEQAYYTNLTDYNSVKTLYDSYIDGGDTEATKLDIQTAQPDDMWELRAQLLGDSPHLSLDVLKEAADKTEVFTESALFDILAANPDELKKDTLLSYLENKEEPLPAYMIDLLKQLAGGTTYKTALHQQMAEYSHNYSRAAHDIIRSILNDTITDNLELRNWLDNLGGITSDRQIITTYISEGNFTDAFALANMLPQLYNMKGTDLTEHSYYMDMLNLHQSLYQQGRNTFQLNSTEKADITFIANNSNGLAGAQAKSILEGVYDEYFIDCPDVAGAAGYKSSNIIDPDALGKAYGLNISVKPNPAKQWAAFDYTLPGDETQATLTISNSLGNTVEILELSGQQGQKLWDIRDIKPGVYIYTIQTTGFSQSGKIVISE